MSQDITKKIIGSEEWCAFPKLGVPAIKARVDSGAKTSSIHAVNIQTFHRDGDLWVSFEVHPLQFNRRVLVRCERPIVDRRIIKNSSGYSETRFVITTPLKMNEKTWNIELTLSNRESMGFKMLLGREAMKGRLIVDPSLQCTLGQISKESIEKIYAKKRNERAGLKIALLTNNKNFYSNRRLLEAGEKRGHKMLFLNMEKFHMQLDPLEPQARYRGSKHINNLDAVLNRIGANATFYGTALARQFESMGIYTCNSSSAIQQAQDKLFSLELLLKSGINIPATGYAHSPINIDNLIKIVGGPPLIIKLLEDNQNRGVILAKTHKNAESIIYSYKSLRQEILVQQFIKEANGKDLRCFVINGRVVASIERTATPGEFRSKRHQKETATIIEITPEERSLACKTAKVLGLHMASVDIIRAKSGPLLLKVNSSPELEDIETATGKDIAKMVITSIEKKLRWTRPEASSRN